MLTRGIERFPVFRKMDGANRLMAFAVSQLVGQQRLDRGRAETLQHPVNDAAESALREPFGRRINRRDPPKMDRYLVVAFDHFELGMIHADAIAPPARFTKNHQLLTGGDHLLDVM